MKNNTTELVFILDRSGSMGGLESDTIGGFNAMIEKQKKLEGKCFVTTFLFDNEIEKIHDRVELKNMKAMTDEEYYVRGCTALLDAIGEGIEHIKKIHKYARPEDVPANTMFVITTDGMENASSKFSSKKVKYLIEKQKKDHGWEFIFVAANIDAVETAKKFGIDEDRAVDYLADSEGTGHMFDCLCSAACYLRTESEIDKNWSKKLKDDYKKRK